MCFGAGIEHVLSAGVLLALVVLFCAVMKRGLNKQDGYKLLKEGQEIKIAEIKVGERIGKGNFGEVRA